MTTTTVTLAQTDGPTQAHRLGCKAATRRKNRVEATLTAVSLDTLHEMLANPDEGHVQLHNCLKGVA
jgi:hypothetical protein